MVLTKASVATPELASELRTVHTLLKETDARSRVLFSKIHNLQTEVAALTDRLGKTLALLSELFDRPATVTEAQSVIHDFLRKQFNKGAS